MDFEITYGVDPYLRVARKLVPGRPHEFGGVVPVVAYVRPYQPWDWTSLASPSRRSRASCLMYSMAIPVRWFEEYVLARFT